MKKKRLFLCIAACIIAVTSIAGLNANKTVSNDITLDGLVMTSAVNAECRPHRSYSPDGKCIWPSQHCVHAYGYKGCDPGR